MHQRRLRVVGRAGREVAFCHGRVMEHALPLASQAHGRQRVEQHLHGPRVRAGPRRRFRGGRAIAQRGEHVEFQRGENRAALLEPAYALLQVLRQRPGGVPGAHGGQALGAVGQNLGAHVRPVRSRQAVHRRVLFEMRADNLRHVRRRYPRVPHALRIDDHVGTPLAQAERPARGHLDVVLQPARVDLAPQRLNHLGRAPGAAPRHALRLLLVAHKHVKTERFHG